jgi:hypothetical protein
MRFYIRIGLICTLLLLPYSHELSMSIEDKFKKVLEENNKLAQLILKNKGNINSNF